MATQQRRLSAFDIGQGIEPEPAPVHTCADCGYAHTNRKNFKRTDDGDGFTCSTGHYSPSEGVLKRNKNGYAKWGR